MENILEAPFMRNMRKVAGIMYDKGWDERNGGNISLMLDEAAVAPYLDLEKPGRMLPMAFDASFLAGRLFLVTGTGKYFMNVPDDPENNLGIIRVAADGHGVEVLWGYADGGAPTSELPAHFMSHIERLKQNPDNRVVMHTHATNLLAMTFVEELSDRHFTRIWWFSRTGWGSCPGWSAAGTKSAGLQPKRCGNTGWWSGPITVFSAQAPVWTRPWA